MCLPAGARGWRLAMAVNIQSRARQRLGLVFVAPLILSGVAFWSTAKFRRSTDDLLRSQGLIVQLEQLLSLVKDAETGQRGFVITGKPSYLDPYRHAVAVIDSKLHELRALVRPEIQQEKHLRRLAPLIARKLDELRRTIDLRRNAGFTAAAVLVDTDEGRKLMLEIRDVISEMEALARSRLDERAAEQTKLSRFVTGAWVAVTGTTGFVLLSLYSVLRKYITQRDEAESKLHSLNTELEQQVQERTKELLRSNEHLRFQAQELARSNADLERYAYAASHDLQEPLRNVSLYSQLLGRRYRDRLDEQAEQYLSYLQEGALRMSALVADLLSYSKVVHEDTDVSDADCESALATALSNNQRLLKETEAVVTHDPLPAVPANWNQLVQVFQQLINNALKFHSPEQQPRIHVSMERLSDEWVFSVQDNGIGISPQYHDRVFVIFQRLDRKHAGSGVGLALCKRIVERHAGRIWVESELGNGATFRFTIPVQRARIAFGNTA